MTTAEELLARVLEADTIESRLGEIFRFAAEVRRSAMSEVERIKRWKVCEQCGKHRAGYIASGDDGDTDLCACCYGDPYDAQECVTGTGLDGD